jgi:ketosteroid isomerase-like protein
MTFLSEDPSWLLVALVLATGAFLVALKVTQRAKYLFWAFGTLGLAGTLMLIDRLWVTDAERIEQVVADLRRAVLASDVEGVLKHLTSDVEYGQGGTYLSAEATKELIRSNLANATFDFVHIAGLQTSAGETTRRGKAEFQVYAKGTLRMQAGSYNVGTANSTWSLGFQETAPGTWKVNRITPVSIPEGTIHVPPGYSGTTGKSGGHGDRNH